MSKNKENKYNKRYGAKECVNTEVTSPIHTKFTP